MTLAGKLTSDSFDHPAVLTHIERADAPSARFSLIDDMIVERGTADDWALLHELHYKVEGRPAGSRYWRLALHGETIGVLVTGNPKGLLKERHVAFPQLKPKGTDGKLNNTQRYVWVNANMRVVSRFVIETMYRGIGAGYRMMNLVSRLENRQFMEIQSSMSKFNLFGQKAGFRFVSPMNSNHYEIGLKFFRATFRASPQDYEAIIAEINALPPQARERLINEVKDFYYRHSALEKTGQNAKYGRTRVDAMDVKYLIKNLQQMTLSSPMYGVWKNPDWKRALPESLPLSAFDRQGPNEPLVF